ncbi:hypothetical protein SMD44_06821 [Streptomyces alboflavus]|uniref:Uncharacterized protein n=1 Tax=Streptomyces alboflavus TaxID=67267 RepID=A0A1Z1WLS7_9ACTN|nr:hypothetical protein SMD44_06821 [Streptomyces alboflavus]
MLWHAASVAITAPAGHPPILALFFGGKLQAGQCRVQLSIDACLAHRV